VVADDGSEGIQAVFEARNQPGRRMAFTAFDLLELEGHRSGHRRAGQAVAPTHRRVDRGTVPRIGTPERRPAHTCPFAFTEGVAPNMVCSVQRQREK